MNPHDAFQPAGHVTQRMTTWSYQIHMIDSHTQWPKSMIDQPLSAMLAFS